MRKKYLFILAPLLLILLVSYNHFIKEEEIHPSKTYKFSYISVLLSGKTQELINWENPRLLENGDKIGFEIINDSVIYKNDYNKDGKIMNKHILNRTPLSIQQRFKPVPQHYLDFDLLGVYHFTHVPEDIWDVCYYSKKRNAFLTVQHAYELNRIVGIILFMSNPDNPFNHYNRYFKFPTDSVYHYPVMKDTINVYN